MTDAEVLTALDNPQTLALTAWAEARQIPRDDPRDHSPVEELVAVMCVIRNRRVRFARWRASDASYKAICLAPAQFSCWTPASGSNHTALMAQAALFSVEEPLTLIDPELRECLTLAADVIAGALIDRTGGADSYYAPAAMVPVGRVPPGAIGRPRILIGDQWFYKA